MKSQTSKTRALIVKMLLSALVLNSLINFTQIFAPIQAQNGNGKPIVISFGQPNIWSLEQAHYLLARMRARSLDLQSKEFGVNDLDPNEVTGTRLQSLKTMLGISAGFNQATGSQNDQARRELAFNQDRRHQLLALRDQRQADARAVNDQLATLRVEREKMNTDDSSPEVKKLKEVEIEQQVQRQSQINGEITSLTSELNGITAPGTSLASATPPSSMASPIPDSVVDKLVGTDGFKTELGNLPKVDASTKLDNHLNLQYEIIAKQLTLLRDEVGPGQRLVFLELPQSFYTVPDKANRMVAQVWWHIDGFYERTPAGKQKSTEVPEGCPNSRGKKPGDDEREKDEREKDDRERIEREKKAGGDGFYNALRCNPQSAGRSDDVLEVIDRYRALIQGSKTNLASVQTELANQEVMYSPARNMRAIDLIPRQSALNVNDIQDRQKNFNLMGLFTWLSGLGVSVNYQREQRLYQQFIQQDVYASAFGKGQSDFGWTFGARPGNERISPGLQNTYAILVVPEKAETIMLKARGCYFPRASYGPNDFSDTANPATISSHLRCSSDTPETTFNLVVPSTSENNFWVTGLKYRPVRPGERATVYVYGDYFSPQVGVLVNGLALRHSIGLAQSELALTKKENGFDPTPIGDFEFVNSKLLVLSFSIPTFKGTPSIALVTPGRARVLNDLRIVINDSYKCKSDDVNKLNLPNCLPIMEGGVPKLDDQGNKIPSPYKLISKDKDVAEEHSIWVTLDKQRAMFSDTSPAPVLAVESLRVFESPAGVTFIGQLTGSKFDDDDEIRVNGKLIEAVCYDSHAVKVACRSKTRTQKFCNVNGMAVKCPTLIAPGLFEFEFPSTNESNLDVTVVHTDKNPEGSVYSSRSFPNPLVLRVDKSTVLGFQPDKKPFPLLSIQLEGVGFSSRLEIRSKPDAIVRRRTESATNMVFELQLLKHPEFLTLELFDPRTGIRIPVVIATPEEPPKKESNEGTPDTPAKPKPAKRRPPVKKTSASKARKRTR